MKPDWKKLVLTSTVALLAFPLIAQNVPPATTTNATSRARTIMIHAKKFEFIPEEITLKKDQTVKLELTSDDVEHSLVIPALKINGVMKKGEVTEVIVTPTQIGNFSGKCGIYCGLGHNKMHFTVHVVN
ncbi:MAG: cupredoxin domain-containing protein [Acidobacteriaceae bacterium]